jgi:glycosyltransferase involved in cell wall biosynthesis
MNKILNGQLKYISDYYEVVGISRFVEKDFEEIRNREGIRMIAVPFERTINLTKDLVCLIKLIQIFRKEKPYIVHTHTPKAGLLGMIAAKITNVPVRLHTVGGLPLTEIDGFKLKVLKFTEKLTYRFAHKIYPNSVGLRDFIIRNNFTTVAKLQVIGNGSSNGVDANFYKSNYEGWQVESSNLKRKLGISETDFVFLFLGRLAKEKGIHELLLAFIHLKNTNRKIKLLLVGTLEIENGSISDEDIKIIEKNSDIIYPGRTDNVRAFLRIGDCFVFPTYREGFPNALLQAGAMSLPIIATDINGCNEIIEDGLSGYLIAIKDEKSLYDKMNFILSNEEMRAVFAYNIRATLESKFKQSVIWESLLEEYKSFDKQNKKI